MQSGPVGADALRITAAMLVAAATQIEQAGTFLPSAPPAATHTVVRKVRRGHRRGGDGEDEGAVLAASSKAAPPRRATGYIEPHPPAEPPPAGAPPSSRRRIGGPSPPAEAPPQHLVQRQALEPAPSVEAGPEPNVRWLPPPPVPAERLAARVAPSVRREQPNSTVVVRRQTAVRTPSRSPPRQSRSPPPFQAGTEPTDDEQRMYIQEMELPDFIYVDGDETSEEDESQQDARRSNLSYTETISRRAIKVLRHELQYLPHKENGGVYATTLARYLTANFAGDTANLRTGDIAFLASWDRGRFEAATVDTGHDGNYEKRKTLIRATRRIDADLVPAVVPGLELEQQCSWILSERERRQASNRCSKRRAKDRAKDLKLLYGKDKGKGKSKSKGKGGKCKGKGKGRHGKDVHGGK